MFLVSIFQFNVNTLTDLLANVLKLFHAIKASIVIIRKDKKKLSIPLIYFSKCGLSGRFHFVGLMFCSNV